MLYPEIVEVLAVHVRFTECWVAVTPEPLSEITVGESVALLANEAEPLTLPLACGAN